MCARPKLAKSSGVALIALFESHNSRPQNCLAKLPKSALIRLKRYMEREGREEDKIDVIRSGIIY